MRNEMDDLIHYDFLIFSAKAFAVTNNAAITPDPYLTLLAERLARVATGKTKRLVVNLPPRHFKTWMGTICLSAWILAHNPSAKIHRRDLRAGARRQDRLRHPRNPQE